MKYPSSYITFLQAHGCLYGSIVYSKNAYVYTKTAVYPWIHWHAAAALVLERNVRSSINTLNFNSLFFLNEALVMLF